MDTDREAHEVGDKHYPAHRRGSRGILLPLEHEPHHKGRKHRRQSVHLALDSREPEGVGVGVGHGANGSRAYDEQTLKERHILALAVHDAAHKVGDGPKEEHDAEARGYAVHAVNHCGDILG